MDTKNDVFEKSRSVRDMQHLRFMALLQELESDHGRKKAAALLGVDRRTLDASLDEGVLSRRIRGALDKALQYGLGSAAAEQRDRNDKLSDRLDDLESRIEKVANETSAGRRACEEATSAVREEHSQAHREMERAMAGLKAQGAADGGPNDTSGRDGGEQPRGKAPLRREYPDLVTLEPAPGDEEAFGDAWPLIVEWRKLKATHPNEGRGLRVAAGRGAVPDGGADPAGGARPDASPGEFSSAGLRPQRPGQLAEDRPVGHAESEGQTRAPPAGQAGLHPSDCGGGSRGARHSL